MEDLTALARDECCGGEVFHWSYFVGRTEVQHNPRGACIGYSGQVHRGLDPFVGPGVSGRAEALCRAQVVRRAA